MLEQFGITRTTNNVYREAYERPGQNVRSIAETLALPVPEVVASIAELAALGLTTKGDSESLQVVPPITAAKILIARQEADLAALNRQLLQSKTYADHLGALGTDNDIIRSEVIVGRDAIQQKLQELSHKTERDVANLAPGGAHSSEDLEASREATIDLFQRNVRSRGVFLSSVRNSTVTMEFVDWLNDHGGEVRTVPTLPIRMIIADKKVAIIPSDPEDAMRGIVVIRGPGPVLALQALFESIWATATPFGKRMSVDSAGLTDDERAVLELLALGRTDLQVARSLGVSERAARRVAKALMDRLGASSRFEAGYRATKLGWL